MPELADILRLHGPDYVTKYHDRLLPSHRRAIKDICACRTETLGGHLYRCPQCHKEHYQYHSCKNRHCPKCQNEQVNCWIDQQRALLLSVPLVAGLETLRKPLAGLDTRQEPETREKVLQQNLPEESGNPGRRMRWEREKGSPAQPGNP